MSAHPQAAQVDDLDDGLFNQISKYVYEKTKITLGKNKKELVRARFGKIIRQRGMSGFREYLHWVQSDVSGDAIREMMNAISTNLTSFFRENEHFVFLSGTLIPEIARNPASRAGGMIRLRGWSAGCSTGEEVYTMAMVISEAVTRLEEWDIKLLATDIDTNVVAHGQRGIYEQDRLEGVKPSLIGKYFTPCPNEKGRKSYQTKEVLRRMITFRHLNLFNDWPFRHKFNFIFCRNVMIYFDRPTQENLINHYYEVLNPGGYMFIGHSESMSGVSHKFEYVKPTIYRRKDDPEGK
ncbi:MAG: protein-glutamate O-methyltransferase CheR [Planctomycetota bacterium]|jgi:chemotaxis protein methyltransferase CheR|nr:protein-glutamate O-methyltransferase CheR [Planctomycetota bacterium]